MRLGQIVVPHRLTGTHTGDLMGMPATGKHVSVEAADIGRIGNGLAKERWGGLNVYSMLTQLGVIPAPQRATLRPGLRPRSGPFGAVRRMS